MPFSLIHQKKDKAMHPHYFLYEVISINRDPEAMYIKVGEGWQQDDRIFISINIKLIIGAVMLKSVK